MTYNTFNTQTRPMYSKFCSKFVIDPEPFGQCFPYQTVEANVSFLAPNFSKSTKTFRLSCAQTTQEDLRTRSPRQQITIGANGQHRYLPSYFINVPMIQRLLNQNLFVTYDKAIFTVCTNNKLIKVIRYSIQQFFLLYNTALYLNKGHNNEMAHLCHTNMNYI